MEYTGKDFVRLTNIDSSQALKKDWEYQLSKLIDYEPNLRGTEFDNLEIIFNSSWIESLKSKNINLKSCVVFERDPYYQHFEAHFDIDHQINIGRMISYSFNLIADYDTDSYMTWYKINKEEDLHPIRDSYLYEECTEIIAVPLNQCRLWMVRTGDPYPHSVRMGSRKRVCFSFKFRDNYMSWTQALDFYKDILEN
jgi:hypothetical protein